MKNKPITKLWGRNYDYGHESMIIINCELCQQSEQILTKHHLIPRAVHTKKKFVNRFGKKEMRDRGIMICKLCHDGIHDIIPSEKELAESFNTKELLLADPRIVRHIAWVVKQK